MLIMAGEEELDKQEQTAPLRKGKCKAIRKNQEDNRAYERRNNEVNDKVAGD